MINFNVTMYECEKNLELFILTISYFEIMKYYI